MKNKIKKIKFILILIPLALFISILDKKTIDGFLSTNETSDHFIFLGILVTVVSILLMIILKHEKDINK
ncbi:MAG: hypothetical protein ACI9TK_000664 [Flavobacteriaceae bacterium]|jgi:hypothetical protein|tara:strand:- start:4917 stop:5123 length:207 start_codon:yes stop_codon:yes gene_type:complete